LERGHRIEEAARECGETLTKARLAAAAGCGGDDSTYHMSSSHGIGTAHTHVDTNVGTEIDMDLHSHDVHCAEWGHPGTPPLWFLPATLREVRASAFAECAGGSSAAVAAVAAVAAGAREVQARLMEMAAGRAERDVVRRTLWLWAANWAVAASDKEDKHKAATALASRAAAVAAQMPAADAGSSSLSWERGSITTSPTSPLSLLSSVGSDPFTPLATLATGRTSLTHEDATDELAAAKAGVAVDALRLSAWAERVAALWQREEDATHHHLNLGGGGAASVAAVYARIAAASTTLRKNFPSSVNKAPRLLPLRVAAVPLPRVQEVNIKQGDRSGLLGAKAGAGTPHIGANDPAGTSPSKSWQTSPHAATTEGPHEQGGASTDDAEREAGASSGEAAYRDAVLISCDILSRSPVERKAPSAPGLAEGGDEDENRGGGLSLDRGYQVTAPQPISGRDRGGDESTSTIPTGWSGTPSLGSSTSGKLVCYEYDVYTSDVHNAGTTAVATLELQGSYFGSHTWVRLTSRRPTAVISACFHPKPLFMNPIPYTLKAKLYTLDSRPYPLHPKS
jgi:hypothetical protein